MDKSKEEFVCDTCRLEATTATIGPVGMWCAQHYPSSLAKVSFAVPWDMPKDERRWRRLAAQEAAKQQKERRKRSLEAELDAPLAWQEAGDDGFSIAYCGHCMVSVSPSENAGEWIAALEIAVPAHDGISVESTTFRCAGMLEARKQAEELPYRYVAELLEALIRDVVDDAVREALSRLSGRKTKSTTTTKNKRPISRPMLGSKGSIR
jgi:hypothetical protein